MSKAAQSVVGWHEWLADSPFLKSKLGNANEENAQDYFARIHPSTEALLHRIILVGLRRNEVQFEAAENWLLADNAKLTRTEFPRLFDKLYTVYGVSWGGLMTDVPELSEIWSLWLDFTKIIRNHVLHGVRPYSDEWLTCAIGIDQALVMLLDAAMTPIIGGRLCHDLRKLSPRLPKGILNRDLVEVTGVRKLRQPSPPISLTNVQERLSGLSMFLPQPTPTVGQSV